MLSASVSIATLFAAYKNGHPTSTFFFVVFLFFNFQKVKMKKMRCLKKGKQRIHVRVIRQRVPLLYEGTVVIQLLLGR